MDANGYVLLGYGLMVAGALAALLTLTWSLMWMASHEDDAATKAEAAIVPPPVDNRAALDALASKAEEQRRRLAFVRRDR